MLPSPPLIPTLVGLSDVCVVVCAGWLTGECSTVVYKLTSITGIGGLKKQGQRLLFYIARLANSVSFGFNNFMPAINSLILKELISFISSDIVHFTDRGT